MTTKMTFFTSSLKFAFETALTRSRASSRATGSPFLSFSKNSGVAFSRIALQQEPPALRSN